MKTVIAEAPGRVNLIGEHTDYNAGFVLPTLVPQTTRVELSLRNDSVVSAASDLFDGEQSRAQFTLGSEKTGRGWLDYIQGVCSVLRSDGHKLPRGFDLRISSRIPVGSGLSSSAALEVALMRVLREAFGLALDDVSIAKLGQRVENDFVGARVGIMDQMASSVGRLGEALFLDCRDLSYRTVPLPLDRMDLVVLHSGITHSHAGGEYNERRAQCEEACRILGIHTLRELEERDLGRIEAALPELLFRRARHVVTENARVRSAVSALEQGDAARLGALFYDSHRSMRDDYEVSIPDIDLLISLASQQEYVLGARMTGGGFGGSVVILSQVGKGNGAAQKILEAYRISTGRSGMALVA